MPVQDYSQEPVCVAHWRESVRAVAQRAQRRGVGCVVVVHEGEPKGVLSDRDMVLGALDRSGDAGSVSVGDLVERPCVSIAEGASLAQAAARMGEKGVRRLPVVDEQGALSGIVALDDLAGLFITELEGLAAVLAAQCPGGPAGMPALTRESPSSTDPYADGEVPVAAPDTRVRELAQRMRAQELGALVIAQDERPIGIVTDRDLMQRVIAVAGSDPDRLTARSVMSTPLRSVESTEPIERIVDEMAAAGVRRVAVLREGRLVGLVTLDELLVGLIEELHELAQAVRGPYRQAELRTAPRRIVREARDSLRDFGERVARAAETLRGP